MKKEAVGGWVIHHAQKMKDVKCGNNFPNIQLAGTCGILLAALTSSEDETLPRKRYTAIAETAGLTTTDLQFAIGELKKHALLDTSASGEEIRTLGLTQQAVLQQVGSIFESQVPNSDDTIVIELAEKASMLPVNEKIAKEEISDENSISSTHLDSILQTAGEIGFFDKLQISNESLIYNGNLFRRDQLKKSEKILDALNSADMRKVQELLKMLDTTVCLLASEAEALVGRDLFLQLHSIGAVDLSEISNAEGKTLYLSRPSAYAKYGNANDDPLDDAKALVTSLTYGMTQSQSWRGRIMDLPALMRALISGRRIGAATAIGEDYRALELKNVVKTRYEGGDKYSMILLKKDVGELALQALMSGNSSHCLLPPFRTRGKADIYSGPEGLRVEARRALGDNTIKAAELLRAMRADS